MQNFDWLEKQADKVERMFLAQKIYANEAAQILLTDIEYDIDRSGCHGRLDWFIGRISTMPTTIQAEVEKYVRTPDDEIFVRVRHCSAPFPVPADWKPEPTPIRAVVHYETEPPRITIYQNDNSNYDLKPDDAHATAVFALRRHFDEAPTNAG